MYSMRQLKRDAALQPNDLPEIAKCRRPQNRLGFAYQISFVRLLNRFPAQQPFEVVDDLVTFSAVQIGVDAGLIDLYRRRRQTISEHQQAIIAHLKLRHFGDAEAVGLEQFVFEESCRLERTVALQARAKGFLKERRILEPAESRIARLVAEQRKAASEHIFKRIIAGIPNNLAHTRTRQPHRVGQRCALRSVHPRSEADSAPPKRRFGRSLACISTRICLVPSLNTPVAWAPGKRR